MDYVDYDCSDFIKEKEEVTIEPNERITRLCHILLDFIQDYKELLGREFINYYVNLNCTDGTGMRCTEDENGNPIVEHVMPESTVTFFMAKQGPAIEYKEYLSMWHEKLKTPLTRTIYINDLNDCLDIALNFGWFDVMVMFESIGKGLRILLRKYHPILLHYISAEMNRNTKAKLKSLRALSVGIERGIEDKRIETITVRSNIDGVARVYCSCGDGYIKEIVMDDFFMFQAMLSIYNKYMNSYEMRKILSE